MKKVGTAAAPAGRREDRQSRRKQETRHRLVEAALVVMARKGAEAATINDITEEADVGFGSFYNHFQSKEEIRAVVTQELLDRFGRKLDALAGIISDPVEVIAASMRLVFIALAAKPDWADFMANIGRLAAGTDKGLVPRMRRDIDIAIAAGSLSVPDLTLSIEALTGALPAMIQAMRRGDIPAAEAPERITAVVLRLLGVDEGRIRELMSRPLPTLPVAD